MKIISTVHTTKNKVMAESGSMRTPISSVAVPTGSQGITLDIGFSARSGFKIAETNTIMPSSQEIAAAPIAREWLSALRGEVNSIIAKNASSGGRGINQTSIF